MTTETKPRTTPEEIANYYWRPGSEIHEAGLAAVREAFAAGAASRASPEDERKRIDAAYEQGYEDGESSAEADRTFAREERASPGEGRLRECPFCTVLCGCGDVSVDLGRPGDDRTAKGYVAAPPPEDSGAPCGGLERDCLRGTCACEKPTPTPKEEP